MIRVIKRYESRKLYDTEESRYVSLEDLSRWVREGQEIRVLDNAIRDGPSFTKASRSRAASSLTGLGLERGSLGASIRGRAALETCQRRSR